MPSWNEKLYVPPMINVNLKPCMPTCSVRTLPAAAALDPRAHSSTCPGAPVLIPCPIPRTVTFKVALGECVSACGLVLVENNQAHADWCPASNPIRVSCSIGGETWAESVVANVDWQTRNGRGDWCPSPMSHEEHERATAICCNSWGFIKSLVLGHSLEDCPEAIRNMRSQRDTMFAALSDMARAEEAASRSQNRAHVALGDALRLKPHHNIEANEHPSAYMLERFVTHVIEQVGVLR